MKCKVPLPDMPNDQLPYSAYGPAETPAFESKSARIQNYHPGVSTNLRPQLVQCLFLASSALLPRTAFPQFWGISSNSTALKPCETGSIAFEKIRPACWAQLVLEVLDIGPHRLRRS